VKLDRAILDLANPATVWRKLRPQLLDAHVSPYQLAVLEDAFVRNVLMGRDVLQSAMLESADKQRISSDARAIIQAVIGSGLFELIKALVLH
jgi:hypothetical protein